MLKQLLSDLGIWLAIIVVFASVWIVGSNILFMGRANRDLAAKHRITKRPKYKS